MIGVVDYGASNLASVGNALDHLSARWRLCASESDLAACEKLILPGVGNFGAAVDVLQRKRLIEPLRAWCARGRPVLGICLGAQLLLEASEEAPGAAGLGVIPGRVRRLATRTVPHMGWNCIEPRPGASLLPHEASHYFYFAHSFVCEPDAAETAAAWTWQDGQRLCAAIESGRVFGVQFHPEKSGPAGLELLRRFAAC